MADFEITLAYWPIDFLQKEWESGVKGPSLETLWRPERKKAVPRNFKKTS